MIVPLLALLQNPVPGGVVDQGTLVIRADTQEVGRETFRLMERRVGDSTAGWLLYASARWTGGGRTAVYAPVIEVGRDSLLQGVSVQVTSGTVAMRISGQPVSGHFTLRYVSPGIERARELPADRQSVVIDDSVFAPYLLVSWRARAAAESLTAVFPRSAVRATLLAQDLGTEATTLNRDQTTLRHILITGPSGPVHVWLGTGGRLMKVEIPDKRLTAERLPS